MRKGEICKQKLFLWGEVKVRKAQLSKHQECVCARVNIYAYTRLWVYKDAFSSSCDHQKWPSSEIFWEPTCWNPERTLQQNFFLLYLDAILLCSYIPSLLSIPSWHLTIQVWREVENDRERGESFRRGKNHLGIPWNSKLCNSPTVHCHCYSLYLTKKKKINFRDIAIVWRRVCQNLVQTGSGWVGLQLTLCGWNRFCGKSHFILLWPTDLVITGLDHYRRLSLILRISDAKSCCGSGSPTLTYFTSFQTSDASAV